MTYSLNNAYQSNFAKMGQFVGQQPPCKYSEGTVNSHHLETDDSVLDMRFSCSKAFCSMADRAHVSLAREDGESSKDLATL